MLLKAIEHRWGYDFQDYARASIKRRIKNSMIRHRINHISEMIPRVLHEPGFFQDVVSDFSITVTEMFRDPHVWSVLRQKVFPVLRTWPYFKIWHAACATGEEAYSMAILLDEAGLLERSIIYATDFNDHALKTARDGIYSLQALRKASDSYLKAGGQYSLSRYYTAHDDYARIIPRLRKSIVWSNHNLVLDRVFGEMNLILCRNVLIYFTQPLQNRVLELFCSSLTRGGFLCLGSKESLSFSSVNDCYDPVALKDRIYRRMRCDHLHPADFLQGHQPAVTNTALSRPSKAFGAWAIGCSWGGIDALHKLLPTLPADFPLPVLITIHVGSGSEGSMAEVLQQGCVLPVKEAEAGERICPGTIYVAPYNHHLLVTENGEVGLSEDILNQNARPSINVMFESVAEVWRERAIATLLTGANGDGLDGLVKIKEMGGYVVVQDPLEAEAPAMPQAAISQMTPDRVLSLSRMVGVVKSRANIFATINYDN